MTPDLCGEDNKEGNKEGEVLLVKDLNNSNNMNGINTASPRISKDGDKNMFFNVEGSRIKGKFQRSGFKEDAVSEFSSHQLTKRHHSYLSRNGSD